MNVFELIAILAVTFGLVWGCPYVKLTHCQDSILINFFYGIILMGGSGRIRTVAG
jgi:hypothetical protein